MKQGFFKRAAALTLSAALVLPVSPMNAVAADYVVVSEQAEDTSEFVITNPGDTVNAYVGQPLVFYLRAKGAESFTITGFESLGAEELYGKVYCGKRRRDCGKRREDTSRECRRYL